MGVNVHSTFGPMIKRVAVSSYSVRIELVELLCPKTVRHLTSEAEVFEEARKIHLGRPLSC